MAAPQDGFVEIPEEEMQMAVEAAFLQVRTYRTASPELAAGDQVAYRDRAGHIHLRFVVIETDRRTALIGGFRDGERSSMQLRVMREEVERVADLKGFVHKILSEAHPCPHCHPAGETGRTEPKGN